jgi:ABC-type Fe3+ transport system permease subunit
MTSPSEQPQPTLPNPGPPEITRPKRRRRVFLWVFMAVQVLFVVWIVTGIASGGGTPSDCTGLDEETCNAAQNVGTGIGVALIIGLWMAVDVIMGIIYGVYRLARRT